MAHLIPNLFSSYQLTPEEEEAGSALNMNQKFVIQNKLAAIVADKLNLKFDPTNPLEFAQTEAYLRGQCDALNWLLDISAEVESGLKQRQQEETLMREYQERLNGQGSIPQQ